jgi:hypothetical protein
MFVSMKGVTMKTLLTTLLISLCALAGCFEWSQDSQGNLQSVGLPGMPVWQSKTANAPLTTQLGMTPEESAKMSGPVLVMPTAAGPYRYRFYQAGNNQCAQDLQKIMAQRASTPSNDPAPYCTENPTAPPSQGKFFMF